MHKIGISYKTLVNKASFPSHAQENKIISSWEIAANICNKSCCNRRSQCDLHLSACRQNATNAVMLSCVRRCMPGVCEQNRLRQFLEGIMTILMIDFGSGISEWSNQHLRCCAIKLVHWLVTTIVEAKSSTIFVCVF